MRQSIIDWIKSFYSTNTSGHVVDLAAYNEDAKYWALAMFAVLIIASFLIWIVARFLMVQILNVVIDRTKTVWDDYLMKYKFFRALAQLVPLMFMEYFLSIVFYKFPSYISFSHKLVMVLIIAVIITTINRFLSAVRDILMENERYRDKPIQSYFQLAKIIFTFIFITFMVSVVTGTSPIYFLTSLGAISAILILVFKDTILGFVGSLQLSANDMIRIGDWVTMDKYGADGEVEEINLATVKVRNFDKTITTIPTYSFISDSFKNWRGMQESDGRRIKRSIKITISSIRFADEELIERLKKIKVLSEFISTREEEIKRYNEENGFTGENAINGRRQTNLGIFRRYIEHYLQHKVEINQDMVLMVRQLESTEAGVPLELYCFTKTKEWEPYELIMSDIFDHVFAMISLFDLEIFEKPSGRDMREMLTKSGESN